MDFNMQYFNHKTQLYLNGKFEKAAEATTNLYSQTLHYGYGAFEGLRAYNTHNGARIFKAEEHFERLKKSCELVNIPYKWNNDHLIRDTYTLLKRNHLRNAYIRPLVFCNPNMKLDKPTDVSIMICAWEWGAYLGEHLLKVGISTYERPNPQSTEIEAKITGHYVTSILASADAKSRGFDEALLLDQKGNIAQSPGANFFMERNGKLYTPHAGNIFPGITRQTVIDICHHLGIEIVERDLTVNDLKHATGAFFCGTATEIIGIKSIDRLEFHDWEDSVGATIQRTYKNLVLEKENYEVII